MDALAPKLRPIAQKLCRLATLDKMAAVVGVDGARPENKRKRPSVVDDIRGELDLLKRFRAVLQEFEFHTKEDKSSVIKHFENEEQNAGALEKSDALNVLGLVCPTVIESVVLHEKALLRGNRNSCYFIAATWLCHVEMQREQNMPEDEYLGKVVEYLRRAYNEHGDKFAAFLLGVVYSKFYQDEVKAVDAMEIYLGEKAAYCNANHPDL